jgi:hypothetical protein
VVEVPPLTGFVKAHAMLLEHYRQEAVIDDDRRLSAASVIGVYLQGRLGEGIEIEGRPTWAYHYNRRGGITAVPAYSLFDTVREPRLMQGVLADVRLSVADIAMRRVPEVYVGFQGPDTHDKLINGFIFPVDRIISVDFLAESSHDDNST